MAEIEGLRELHRQLERLGLAAQGRVLRNSVNVAMTPVVREARKRIPVGDTPHKTYRGRLVAPGFAKRNIKKRTRTQRDKSRAVAMVGVGKEAYYATQFVEGGTKFQPAQPWLIPAFEAKQNTVLDKLSERLAANIEKEARRR